MAALKPRSLSTKSKLMSSPSMVNQTADIRRGKSTTEPPTCPTRSQRQQRTATGRGGRRIASDVDVTDRVRQRRPNSLRQVADNHNEEELNANNEGQDVKFIDVPSESGAASGRPNSKCQTMSPQEILEMSQESKYEDVYDVNLHTCNIGTIPNLEKFTHLRLLDLSCNSIRQIANLHHNKELKELKLYGNEITSVSNLESLVELHTLQLQHNRIQTLGQCLSCLKKLKVLRLDSNRLRKLDSREIASCSQLTVLDISSNKIDTLHSLNCLSSLEELHATHNGLRAVTDLSRCKKLNEVNLSHNKLSDVSGLKGLPHITILQLSHNSLTTSCLKALGKLRSLQNLDVSYNQLTELSGIHEQFPSLEVLNVSDNRIHRWTSICSLAKCSSLSELYLSGNPFCAEQGEKPSYHHEIQELLPNLDILDGIHMKRNSAKSAPVMRPMSAASALSARQVENQLKHVEADLASFGASLAARFESVRSTMESLPLDPPSPRPGTALSIRSVSTSDGSRPGSRCNSRSRILEAQAFATKNF
ncbi:protein phosphatase 1 regulatory subunit 7-like [Patiria miniata]|uniref:Disease resistance R13L4/SHOC-2-like LRR domain-containing protein n=1 Tax=Patiria miniata TaxID=46514 RepID=A0A914AM26_PATMI|nr:protein phosphatase 1 regulatory subunit 7-like [Patiria miniata]